MADHCIFCDIRRPVGGTNILVLNDGNFWCEFCPSCGESNILTNEKGEHWLVRELFNRKDEMSYVRDPMDVIKAEMIAEAESDTAKILADSEYDRYMDEMRAQDQNMEEARQNASQLRRDYWDDYEIDLLSKERPR